MAKDRWGSLALASAISHVDDTLLLRKSILPTLQVCTFIHSLPQSCLNSQPENEVCTSYWNTQLAFNQHKLADSLLFLTIQEISTLSWMISDLIQSSEAMACARE